MKNILKMTILSLLITFPLQTKALTKNESVFSTLNTNGSVYNTTVTNHLKITSKEEIEDNSELKEITNINGTESFTKDKNTLKWKTDGKDIYYQGTTNKNLPLDIIIKYYFNGKETKPEDLKNKKGNIKIEITLTNNEKHYVNINGSIEEVYTPFMVMAGTTLDNKNNQNIKVTNGKIVDTGSKTILTSFASPGLYESLNMNSLKNINKITIDYKTTKFKMNNIYIVATPKLLEKEDLNLFSDIDNLSASINKLQSSMNEINKGSNELSKYTKDLSKGINKLNSKMPSEKENKKNESSLNSLKSTNNSTINTIINANTNLEKQQEQTENKIIEATAKKTYIESQIGDIETNIENATIAYNTYSAQLEQINNTISIIEGQIESTTDEETLAQLKAQLAELKGNQAILNQTVPLLLNQKNALEGTKNALGGTKTALEGTLTLLTQTKNSIATSIGANKGLISLISGNNLVVNSSIETINKMRSLTDGISKLANGSNKISKGANKLANGITEFNKQGIGTLVNYSNLVKKYSNKAEALVDLSKNYDGFTSNNSNETLFINKVKTID